MAFFGRFTESTKSIVIRPGRGPEHRAQLRRNRTSPPGTAPEEGGAAAKVLADLGMEIDKMREYIVRLVGKGNYNFSEGFGYTPRTKR